MISHQFEEIQSARNAELEALSSIASILAGAETFVVKANQVLGVLLRISDANAASIWMNDPEQQGLRLLTSEGSDEAERKALLLYDSLAGRIFKQGQLAVVDDYPSHPSASPNLVNRGVVSFLGMPIAIAGQAQAMITIHSKESKHFTHQRVQLLRAIGDGLGVFLENARLYDQLTTELDQRQKTQEQLVQRSAELEALFNFASILGQPGTFDEKVAQVLNELLILSRSGAVTLRVPEEHDTGLRLVSEVGSLSRNGRPSVLRTQGSQRTLVGLSLAAFQASAPVVANDYPAEPYVRAYSVAQGVKSGIALPISVDDRCLGVVTVLSSEPDHFKPDMVQLLTAIVDGLGALLENARLYREITLIEELGQRRDTFVSVASHELRTPMTTIIGFSELLLHRDPLPDTRREWVHFIHQESQRLSRIVDDLLDVSRIQSDKLSVSPVRLRLREVVISVVGFLQPTTDKHQFIVQCPEEMPQVIADRDKLEQVVANLLTNAIKYSPEGGPITISAKLDRERQQVVASVADQGIGISLENSADLFTTFHRIRRPETEGIRGSGLGLYIVSQLIKLMNGEVWLESEFGKGSTFFFSLPVDQSQNPGQSSLPCGGQFAKKGNARR